MQNGGGVEDIKRWSSKERNRDASVYLLVFCAIQNVIDTCYTTINDNCTSKGNL